MSCWGSIQEFEAATKRERITLQQQTAALQSKEEEFLRLQVWRAYTQIVLMVCIYWVFFRRVTTIGKLETSAVI